ncbi:MAG: hypothetical protein ACE37J_12745 [Pikeienuella sp.]|uniref:hypothetical protein n=1 Tax=Pikeienuella sp. TaxID=2831957 RepID=UPI00391C6E4C
MNSSPPGWGDDELTRFFEICRENQLATFHNKIESKRAIQIDQLFEKIFSKWINPRPSLPVLFFVRAVSAFRASSQLVFSGQIPEAFALLRLCLEWSGYASLIASDPKLFEVWISREDNKKAKRVFRDTFKFGAMRESIRKRDIVDARVFEELIERTIGFGAHPMPISTFNLIEIEGLDNGDTSINSMQIIGDGATLDYSLKTLSQVGICTHYIFMGIYRARYELLGVRYDLIELRKGL